ncbi:nucleotidyltransferase family protein [Aneurinibacillus sp. BA2021]|nr:nucleotidyltransferase family protein [Aneurinibacillus sp. BA2021]
MEAAAKPRIAAIILAAGASVRMGCAKQLLPLDGSYMLEHVIARAQMVEFTDIIAVIGREAERIQQLITVADGRFRWCVNPSFRQGQSTSLKAGMRAIPDEAEGVMIFLGDQPFISEKTVRQVYEQGCALLRTEHGAFAVQPSFQETPGHPVFFGRPLRSAFLQLNGDQGAKPILQQLDVRVLLPVQDEAILIDLDTPEDFAPYNFKKEK